MRWVQPGALAARRAAGLLLAITALISPGIAREARAFEEAEIRAMLANPQDPSRFPGAGGIWMGRERFVSLDGIGNAEIEEHFLAQVFDPDWGERTFRPFLCSYWSDRTRLMVTRARVWHSPEESEDVPREAVTDELEPSAQGVLSCAYDRARRIEFPKLRAGDRVEVSLHWTIPVLPRNKNRVWFLQTFGCKEPVVEQRLILLQPNAAKVQTAELGPAVEERIYPEGGMRRRVWVTGNLPGRALSPVNAPWSSLPAPEDSFGVNTSQAMMTSFTEWKEVSAHFGPQWEEAWIVRDLAMDRLAGRMVTDHADLIERARACARYVREKVRTIPIPIPLLEIAPQPASEVSRDQAGNPRDKTCYLVALLRAAGMRAYPVLLRNHPGLFNRDLACPAQLDRYVVLAQIPGNKDLWLDPTADSKLLSPSEGLILPGDSDARDPGTPSGLIPFPGADSGSRGK